MASETCIEMNRIVTCKHCHLQEFYGEMTWFNGTSYCRSCYKTVYHKICGHSYRWNDKEYTPDEKVLLGRSY